ncbi:2-oxo acid dehydrogenase subunit E2 [Haloarchaeobius sp. DYHT-AS-18]|uniref:2-oxo acid dehydrogenase subunit E2 n=1 Tax=Haloarchaeobius sp. DYHT-AS-18 TaxID=3446117 RepID=UPI003EBBDF86
MATIVRLPKLGLSDRGEIVEWRVAPPDRVQSGDVIAILESDKSAVDIEATTGGVLLTTYVDEGEEIAIEPGRPIAAIGSEGETAPSLDETEDESSEQASEDDGESMQSQPEQVPSVDGDLRVTPKARVVAAEQGIEKLENIKPTGPEESITVSDVERFSAETEPTSIEGAGDSSPASAVKSTPKAKRFASDHSIGLENVTGTGPKGAVTEEDVQRHLEGGTAQTPPPAESGISTTSGDPAGDNAEYTVAEVRELSRVERTVANRLSRSAREKPHVRGNRTVNIEPVERVVGELASKNESSLSVNDLLFRAVVLTLEAHPEFNAVYEDDEYRLIEEKNVGYAVDSEHGLLVPVVKDAGSKSLNALAESRRAVVDRVLDGRHSPSDLQGGTFTVTNVGALGMDSAFSIINPPEVAILVIGRRKPSLFETDDGVETAMGVQLSLLIDHRVLDGGDAGAFLQTLAGYLEQPSTILHTE